MADDLVSNLLKWSEVLDIPSGDFVNEDLRLAAARIIALEAERAAHHANPADFRYWEGRYRDEAARIAELEEALRAVSDTSHRTRDRQHYRFPIAIMEKVDATLTKTPS